MALDLDVEVIQRKEFPARLSRAMLERWIDCIPLHNKRDISRPEWKPTPVVALNLPGGYGRVYVKNEADKESNPTGSIKDRAYHELRGIYRDLALDLHGRLNGSVGRFTAPHITIITAGNEGIAAANSFEQVGLPPVNLIVDRNIKPEELSRLMGSYANIFAVDLRKRALTPEDIRTITEGGVPLNATSIIEPQAVFYDWHVHEAFNEAPDEIYVPHGSGRIFENYLTWQYRNRNELNKDARLRIPASKVRSINVLGAKPKSRHSQADKLATLHNPFAIFEDADVDFLADFRFTGETTGVYMVSEGKIEQAYKLLREHMPTEPSAAAGLALYLQRVEQGKVDPKKKILIVNTGGR